jgi:hypothetical protein
MGCGRKPIDSILAQTRRMSSSVACGFMTMSIEFAFALL